MRKIEETYAVEGYLVDRFGNVLCKEFREYVKATSFEEAENRVKFRVKTERLKLPSNFKVELKQIEGRHFTHRKARDV